jgi:hypothetical protein
MAVALLAGGGKYEGRFAKDLFHGKGCLTMPDGSRYVGEFVRGERHGLGKYSAKNGDVYEGAFAEGKMTGECHVVYTSTKKEFLGTMADGKKVRGKMTFHDQGKTYDGEWDGDKPHGRGAMTFANGDSYTGEFVDGRMHGKGSFHYVSQEGRKYDGEFANDKPHGRGVMTMPNGKTIDTTWEQGKQSAGTLNQPAPSQSTKGPDMKVVETKVVETYENQRTFPFIGYGRKMLPTDRPAWSDKEGKIKLDKTSFTLPPGWEWKDEWAVSGDNEGWEYAMDFYLRYSTKESTMDCVRRRCWKRTMIKKA